MKHYNIEGETIPDDVLAIMTDYCVENYFDDNMIPSCKRTDIEHLLAFYAQKEISPSFNTLDEIDRKKLDLSQIALKIYEEDMSRSKKKEYIDNLWNEDGSILPMYYSTLYFFKRQIDIELDKLDGYIEVISSQPKTEAEKRDIDKLALQDIINIYPKYGLELKEKIFSKAVNANGKYVCNLCGKIYNTRQYLEVDHIIPRSKGGLTVEENLQILCKRCNAKKSDK